MNNSRLSCDPLRRRFWLWVVPLAFCPAVSNAQWVTFEEQTDTRFACGDQEGLNCNIESFKNQNDDEKDYAWADIDGDGDIDFVAVHKSLGTTTGRRRNYLFMNEGGVLVDRTTQYASASDVTLESGPSQGFLDLTNDRDVVIADVNGDDWLDIVTSTTLSEQYGKAVSHPRIYINQGDDPPGSGNWQGFVFDDEDRVPTMPYEPRFCSVSAGDIDGDDDLDLYFGDYIQGPYSRGGDLDNRLWINDGTGYFTDESTLRMTNDQRDVSFAMASAIVDMNLDGFLDVVIDDALSSPTAVSIVYNDPDNEGFFQDMPREFIYNASPYHIFVGDLNNDEWPDLVITDDGNDFYQLNQGNGADGLANFSSSSVLQGSDFNFGGNNYIADLNNDSFNDVIVTNVDVDLPSCSTSSKIYRNFGNLPNVTIAQQGNADIPQSHLNGVHDVGVFDINGDDWLDLILGECGSIRGTKIYVNLPPIGLTFGFPLGLPNLIPPGEPYTFQVQVAGADVGEPVEGTGQIHLSINEGPFVAQPMTHLGDNLYEATLPSSNCIDMIAFYFSAEEAGGSTFTDPSDAPASSYSAIAADGLELAFQDGIEGDVSGWTIVSDPSLTTGEWEQAEPVGTINGSSIAAPDEDAQASTEFTMAFVTENCPDGCSAGDADVDGGPTDLITPTINLQNSDAEISYFRWFYTSGSDVLTTWVTNDGDSPTPTWVLVDSTNGTSNGSNTAWEGASFRVGDFVEPSANVQVRFRAEDIDQFASVVEAGIDLLQVESFVCEGMGCDADVNGDMTVNIDDLLDLLATWGVCPGCPEDINGDDVVGIDDLLAMLAAWGPCP